MRFLTQGLRLLLAMACLLQLTQAQAQTTEPASKQDEQLLLQMRGYAQGLFSFPGGMPVDEDVRKAMAELSRRQRARIAEQMPRWLEEVRRDAAPTPLSAQEAMRRLFGRINNEMVLWRLEPTTPQHDAPLLAALQQPGLCVPPDQQLNALTFIAMAIQRVPAAQRAAVLAEEDRMLQRWGEPRKNLPAAPLITATTSARQAAARLNLNDGVVKDLPPMVPAMIGLLEDSSRIMSRNTWSFRCVQAQWALRAKSAGAASMDAFRYEMASLFMGPTVGGKDDDYPYAARMLGVEGDLRLRLRVDAEGNVLSTEIISRDIRVPGVRNNPPLGLAVLLDDAADRRARSAKYPPEPDQPTQSGPRVIERSFDFHMPLD